MSRAAFGEDKMVPRVQWAVFFLPSHYKLTQNAKSMWISVERELEENNVHNEAKMQTNSSFKICFLQSWIFKPPT